MTLQAPAQPGAEELTQRAGALIGAGRPAEALPLLERALAARPDLASAHRTRGVALSVLGRFGEALAAFDLSLGIDPRQAAALNNRGVALQELRRHAEALESFDRALELVADYGAALGNRGAALRELGRPAEALESCDRALALNADDISALNNRAAALHELGRFEEAAAGYRRVLAAQPRHVTALNNLGNTLTELGRAEEALACYDEALKLQPQAVSAHENRGLLLNELGRREEAVQAIEQAIGLAPRRARAYYNLSAAHRFAPGDPHLEAMLALAEAPEGLSEVDRIELDYALGKALADVGEPGAAFQRLAAGAARKRALVAYDEAAELEVLARAAEAWSAEVIWRGQGVGHPSEVPVFIVGMPRSGTTLVEQILAAHPEVFAAGEIGDLGRVMAEMRTPARVAPRFPDGVAALHGPALRRAGAAYLDRIRARAPQARRITNKANGNFRVAGFIHLALPKARIVHVRRDPMDTGLSAFTKLFAKDHPYTYDLGEIGRYWRAYDALMAHWRRALPEGVMLEVRYEEVVADLEGQARAILAHCGLDWNPACLQPHKAARQVRTASVTQVREPLYASSVGRWRTYEPWLGALKEGLATLIPLTPAKAGAQDE